MLNPFSRYERYRVTRLTPKTAQIILTCIGLVVLLLIGIVVLFARHTTTTALPPPRTLVQPSATFVAPDTTEYPPIATPTSVLATLSEHTRPAPCSPGWVCTTVGAAQVGAGLDNRGIWQIGATGADIDGTASAFAFVAQHTTGNGYMQALLNSQQDTDYHAKAGIAYTLDTSAGTPLYGAFLTPAHQLFVEYRPSQDAHTRLLVGGTGGYTIPLYIRVTRTGDTFSAQTSPNTQVWTQAAHSTITIPALHGALLAGMAVTSHHAGMVGQAVFDNISTNAGPERLVQPSPEALVLPSATPGPRRLTGNGTTGLLWGAYIAENSEFVDGSSKLLSWFDSEVGTNPAQVNVGSDFAHTANNNFNADMVPQFNQIHAVAGVNTTPMYSMDTADQNNSSSNQPTYTDQNIINGNFDSYLTTWFTQAKAYGKPFLLRLMWEMNGNWYPWATGAGDGNNNTNAQYVAAWKHIWTIAQTVGASNVYFVFCVNNSSGYQADYPGDQYVDFLAMDGYNYGTQNGGTFQSFSSVFSSTYTGLQALSSKPILITEVGSTNIGGSLASWITDMQNQIPTNFSKVVAVTWFESAYKDYDVYFDQTAGALAAFQSLARVGRLCGPLQSE